MFRLADTVPLPRIAKEYGFNSHVFQRYEVLLRFGYRDVIVILTMDEQGWRCYLADITECRSLPERIHQRALMRKDTEGHLLVLVVIRRVVITDEIDDGGSRNGRFEESRLRHQPGAELSAVADAFDADTVTVDPQIATDGSAHSVQHVLPLIAVLVTEDRIRERLPVSGRPPIVHHQRGPSAPCINLIFEVERRPLLTVRST